MGYIPPRKIYSRAIILSGRSITDSTDATAQVSQGHTPPNSITANTMHTAPTTTAHRSKTPVKLPRYKQAKLSPERTAHKVSLSVFLKEFFIYKT